MEGALRCSLGSQAQHTHSLEDHTWSIQQSTTTHTKHIHNIQQQNSNYTKTHCEWFHQTMWSPKCAAITGVGVAMSPHCFIKCPNGSASYTASGSKV